MVENLNRLEKMRKIAVQADKWPSDLPFNTWTEEEAEKFFQFHDLEVPEKKPYFEDGKELSWLDRFLIKINLKYLGRRRKIIIASWPGPCIVSHMNHVVNLNYFYDYTNPISAKTEWALFLEIYPQYNFNVVDLTYKMVQYLTDESLKAHDLDRTFYQYPAKQKHRIIREKNEGIDEWDFRIAQKLQQERLKMQKAHEKRIAWFEEENRRVKGWKSWADGKVREG